MFRLRYEREHHGLSQDQLRVLVGPPIHQSTLSLIESGRLDPTPDQLTALAHFFGVDPPEDLLKDVVVVGGSR